MNGRQEFYGLKSLIKNNKRGCESERENRNLFKAKIWHWKHVQGGEKGKWAKGTCQGRITGRRRRTPK